MRQRCIQRERMPLLPQVETELAQWSGDVGSITQIFVAVQAAGATISERDAAIHLSRLRIYVDGEVDPRVDVTLDALTMNYWSPAFASELIGNEGFVFSNAMGGYLYIQAPFVNSMRVTLTNAAIATPAVGWTMVGFRTGGLVLTERLHNAELVNASVAPYATVTLLDVVGAGRFHGLNFFMDSAQGNLFALEGNFRFYVDGEVEPSWESSGGEDYFGGAFFFARGRFATRSLGCTLLTPSAGRMAAYRWHLEDPVPFTQSLRLTWQAGEQASGNAITGATAISTNCWFYKEI